MKLMANLALDSGVLREAGFGEMVKPWRGGRLRQERLSAGAAD